MCDWIAVDWGTTNLRCWAMSRTGEVLDQVESDRGMANMPDRDFEGILLDRIDPWLSGGQRTPVHACGMVGARQGWQEVPYDETPCSPVTRSVKVATESDRIDVYIRAGVSQSDPPDVMRGEETQIAGLLAEKPDFEGLVCLPGTHSKWVTVQDGEIKSFQTFMTGEIYSLLAEQSVLRHDVGSSGWDESVFRESLFLVRKDPELWLSHCFRLRAEALLHELDPVAARSRLSGLTIGLELVGVTKDNRGIKKIAIVGGDHLARVYQSAIRALALAPSDRYDSSELTILGLSRQ